MQIIKNHKGVETKVFADIFENEAYAQIKTLANFEAYDEAKIRIMPDAHAGKGCVVGTTMTLKDKLTPALVGVDIGCGMHVVELKNKDVDVEKLDDVINQYIPCGFAVHDGVKRKFDLSDVKCNRIDFKRCALSVGSLGGGNHFIELNKDEEGKLYLVIHSGSRKLGADVCKYYQDLAFSQVNEMSKMRNNLIKSLKQAGREKDISLEIKKMKKPVVDKDLCYLQGDDMNDYINDMKISQQFAYVNRKTMSEIIINKMGWTTNDRFDSVHNYIDFESMIMRKGATSAKKEEKLIIPINMRDGSLICIGKGNEDWNFSAPHGAGRLMSRSKARQIVDMDEFKQSMKGIYSSSVMESTKDEAPQVYKPMNVIVDAIKDTLDVIKQVKPIYNFKAH